MAKCNHPRARAALQVVPAAESTTGKRTQASIGKWCPDCDTLLSTT